MSKFRISAKPAASRPHYPKWFFSEEAPETLENATFKSGASLALLDSLLADGRKNVPQEILRQRFTMATARNCLRLEGRIVDTDDIRDAYYLTKPGDEMGPDGDMLELWRKACRINLRNRGWIDRLGALFDHRFGDDLNSWIEAVEAAKQSSNPVTKAHAMLTHVMHDVPYGETPALILADVVLARHLNWQYLMPLASRHVERRLFQNLLLVKDRKGDRENLSLVDFHNSVTQAAQDAYWYGHDLVERVDFIKSVAPKLRSKESDSVVNLFLKEDLISPSSMLCPKIQGTNTKMTPRSARRICERLRELGAVFEVTDRSTSKLYGL
jgi:hypothetical protein